MKSNLLTTKIFCGFALVSASPATHADADDAAWIKKCVSDNKREGATPEVVATIVRT